MALGQRLWRVRKDSRSRELRLTSASDSSATSPVELQRFHDGALVLTQQYTTRTEAMKEAAAQLQTLQIEGWSTHW